MNRPRPAALLAALASAALLATACTPGSGSEDEGAPAPRSTGDVQTDVSALGDVELVLWDQEVRGGQAAQMERLVASFQDEHPNVRIERVSRSFDDLKTTLRLALSSEDAPDVVQANNGRSDMGAFVEAGQLLPLDAYADAYGWTDRYPDSVLQYSRYSEDGATFGEGDLYGLPQVGEVVGVFYNEAKLAALGLEPPRTFQELEDAMATAKEAGELPMQLGNLDGWPAIHVFGTVLGAHVPAEQVTELAFGRPGQSWTTPEAQQAAEQLRGWVDAGYFPEGFNGVGYDPAWQAFAEGEGVFLVGGTWLTADLNRAMGAQVGFMLPPPAEAGREATVTGGTGLPFAVTAQSPDADAAAAFIDHITSEQAMGVLAETGNLPIVDTAGQDADSPLSDQVFGAFQEATEGGGLVPYLDYATPTMYDTLTQSLQDLLGGQASPDEVLQRIDEDYQQFAEGEG
ncbi:extracellular solute-binding protein [Vallicoccus soli]|uniref:Extracellular solute-binding protein n=1 Tax=Vallicoccus soli TaxID=2339232 RepID=A0A3A3ZA99_9ACTN|nr:extracellular solute-binding protein [Vallicoccus soli]RJK98016.1 extracellular solute-binding protein [Vallicoccus soli]